MDVISKRENPLRGEDFAGAPLGSDGEVAWITDRARDPFRPFPLRSPDSTSREAFGFPDARPSAGRPPADWFALDLDFGDERAEDIGPALRVVIEPDRRVQIVDTTSGRRLHHVGEIRFVGRVWRFVLATRSNGFRAPLNSSMAARLAQLDGVPMGGPRNPETLSAEISSLLGYDAHS